MADEEKRDVTDDRYRIAGTNMFNYSQWARENVEYPPPKYKVGDEVHVTSERTITKVGKDCDGSTLYGFEKLGFGYSEEQMSVIDPYERIHELEARIKALEDRLSGLESADEDARIYQSEYGSYTAEDWAEEQRQSDEILRKLDEDESDDE